LRPDYHARGLNPNAEEEEEERKRLVSLSLSSSSFFFACAHWVPHTTEWYTTRMKERERERDTAEGEFQFLKGGRKPVKEEKIRAHTRLLKAKGKNH
jgi:hypothetical protein